MQNSNNNSITILSTTESKAINGGTNGTDDIIIKFPNPPISINDTFKTVCF